MAPYLLLYSRIHFLALLTPRYRHKQLIFLFIWFPIKLVSLDRASVTGHHRNAKIDAGVIA
ncbi:hypothetical protein HMPREF9513_01921 [Enterococcus faecalis TX0645]|nr:hypothetical protein HMPREF9513_01921 [Enterococcus faecalis TX0645]